MTLPIQLSGKLGDTIVVIGGQNAADFQDNLLSILGPDAAETIGNAFKVALVDRVEQAMLTNAADVVQAAGMTKVQRAVQAVTSQSEPPDGPYPGSAVTTPSVPASNGPDTVRSETDKFGRTFSYQVPGAPSCAHGPTVKMDAKAKASGKPYTKWICPTQTPFAFRQKIAKAECDGGGFAK